MRYVVLVFALLGLGGTGFIAFIWGWSYLAESDWFENRSMELERSLKNARPADDNEYRLRREEDVRTFNSSTALFYNWRRTLPFILAGFLFALMGIVLCFLGRGFSAAALLVVGGAGPGVFVPAALLYTGSLVVAGLCALFVRPSGPSRPRRPIPQAD
jgi:hypothetical protein